MALKANKFFTASTPEKGVVLWDTTLKPLCEQLKAYDSETLSFHSLTRKMKDNDKIEFTTKQGVKFIIQKLTR
ncbi:hypothetical protein R5N98_02790 [Tenacibaculum maritimum]|uniref:hypothetical protein n=1 Tax=Tenacibaculum maritimum TaxID=107401 RepID=UPI0012E624CC|nr:hypothetical protein [Tenacibaculum maritimum]MDB0602741.1 hypothetical protein [Tenacibaculum maritimum]MDB0612343.1 hypothetical protein [Tenacibaculum maritimum]CAA0144245.1 conserved hypothetical protein [Tenacibaculum maritimum]CAA0193196.1 hypothetical protein TFA04_210048 [Tenacibaculum maritimum]